MKNIYKTLVLFLALAVILTFNPLVSYAKWKDQSGDLPGMADDGTITALSAVAVVGVGVLVYVLIKKNKQKKAMSYNFKNNIPAISWGNHLNVNSISSRTALANQKAENQSINSLFMASGSTFMKQVENANKTIPINIMISPLSAGNSFAMKNTNGVKVGVRIRF